MSDARRGGVDCRERRASNQRRGGFQYDAAGVIRREEEEEEEEEEMHLYVFLIHNYGEIASSLYRIEVPKTVLSPPSSELTKKQYCLSHKHPREYMEPIIEFPYPEYPREMSCVELDSKLYFLGGHFNPNRDRFSLCESGFPRHVYALDSRNLHHSTGEAINLLQTGHIPSLNIGKPFPYTFIVRGCIFVYDNSATYMDERPNKSLFEVYQPRDREWKRLPDPPFRAVVCGHALFRGKLFLSCSGCYREHGYILCFNVKKRVWLQNFIHGFSEGHRFYGEANLLNDNTLFAISGFNSALPSSFKLEPHIVAYYTSNIPDEEEVPYYMRVLNTDLFDNLAVAAASLKGVSGLAMPYWLSANLVYLGCNRCFCYVRTGPFPEEERPEYDRIILSYFTACTETFNEVLLGSNFNSFTGEFLHASHFKIKSDPKDIATPTPQSCFFVSNKIPRDIKTPAAAPPPRPHAKLKN